jgi:hypothetical protein
VFISGGGTFKLNLPATTASISGNTLQFITGGEQVYNDAGTFLVNGSPGSDYQGAVITGQIVCWYTAAVT